jgi:hypothetical protein
MQPFQIAGGSVAGADHIRAARNSHDAFGWAMTERAVIAVVCDGCGSAPHSEVGAKLGARLAVRTIADHVDDFDGGASGWPEIERDFIGRLRLIADQTGGAYDFFLFTLVAAVITAEATSIAAAGDGVAMINGVAVPFPAVVDNAPPYLGYALLGEPPAALQPLAAMPTPAVQNLLIATDGAAHLGALAPFWTDDRYFRNPDALRRALFISKGPDDTTVVSIRRAAR